jgi:hypothetical protein
MNRTTIISVVVALVAAGSAWSMRPQLLPDVTFEDTGEPLFAGFTDPTLATSLEVVTWDEESAQAHRFAVEQEDGLWVIPSHNDYPADGTERMGKAAASFIDVEKDMYYGDSVEDHAQFGVLDPAESEGKGDEKGKRITIADASGTTLVDIIVGKAVPEKQGVYYVRYPGEKRVYASRIDLDVSTDFTDWIEKDLLHIQRDEITQLHYDPYQVDEAQGKVIGSDPIAVELGPTEGGEQASWVAAPGMNVPKGKALDDAKIRQMASAMPGIKIVGVRPRPEQLTLPLLQSKGFFVTPDGKRLFGNEGQIAAITKDGIVYTLYFGEITYDSGLALTAGNGAAEPKADEVGADGAKPEGDQPDAANRYMFVDVVYNPNLDKSAKPAAQDGEGETPEGEGPSIDAEAVAKGAARAAELRERFDKWFYVISDTSFKQIHKSRDELFKDASAEP